ncbi:MAG: protein kinase domain-containing protein, partial [Bacteroidota bacterium]
MAELRTPRELLEGSEAAIISALLPLSANFTVLPHLMLPGKQWERDPDDIDVVVLAPSGVLLLEYKHWHGRVEMSAENAWQLHFVGEGSESRPNPIPVLNEKAEALRQYFQQRGFEEIRIDTAIVFPERTEREGTIPLPVLSTSGLVGWIEANLAAKGDPATSRKMADELRPPSPIKMVNQYQLTSQLKKTKEKTTYLAYDTILERTVHLCQLQYDPYLDPEVLEKVRHELLREAKLTMDLKHTHILDVRHVIPRDDCYYVISEWIDSCQTLKEVLNRTAPLALEVALEIGIALCSALEYAHNRGVVHRNIRPEAVLISPPHVIKLADFGMAKKADISTRSTFDLRKMAQESPYAAPEFRLGQEGHHRVDGRADLYAVGVILYQMLTGQLPSHVDERYFEPPSVHNPLIPAVLDEVVAKALKFDPNQRYSTASALRIKLEWIRSNTAIQDTVRYTQRKLMKRTRNSLIFQAVDQKLGRTVALKKLLIDPGLNQQERNAELQSLLREAKLASSLNHPHIVSIFDHFIEDDDGYLVMEWIEGGDLRAHLDGEPLSLKEIVSLIGQVGDALEYAHGQGVIHRDIKPENILYYNGRATILDFGIAHAGEAVGQDIGKTAGTARYIAPEILSGQSFDARSDIFSLGVVFYELLTGRYPYAPNTILSKYAELDESVTVTPPSQQNLEVPAELDGTILKALAIRPEERYASMSEFLAELRQSGGKGVQRKGAPRKLIFLSSGVLLVMGAILWGAAFWGSNPPPLPLAESPTPMPLEESPLPELTPTPEWTLEPTPEPTLEPTPSPTPRNPVVSWISRPVAVDGVTIRIERISSKEGTTQISLRISNAGSEPVSFLNRDHAELASLYDDLGNDYTAAI